MPSRDALEAVVELAVSQDGVVSRAQARDLGMDHWAVAHQVRAGRWTTHGSQAIAVHRLPLPDRARCRAAVWNAGEHAALDGSSSLRWQGLERFDDGIHVIVPWPATPRRWDGSIVHSSRLWHPDDITVVDGLPVTLRAVAAVRGGIWARSDRAAATLMAMSVQQRLVLEHDLLAEAKRLNRHKRRPFVLCIAKDIAQGAQALSELDFARLCRQRGLPEPSRQQVRQGPRGRVYLDVKWDDFDVVVEVEGAHHDAPENALDDALRQNALVIGRLGVLRVPVIGLRVCPELFLDQVETLLRATGWDSAA